MGDGPEETVAPAESSYVLSARDYADIAHLQNPGVIERILSRSRTEATTYVLKLLNSGVPQYVMGGPKVAFTVMAVGALTDLCDEISQLRKIARIPEDFSGRPSGYQTWVELLQEIDTNPIDADRLKAMKAMFLAANDINASDGESILAYQLFQVSKKLNSGQLLLLKAVFDNYRNYAGGQRTGGSMPTRDWQSMMAKALGHGLSALVAQDERKLVEHGLIADWTHTNQLEVPLIDARMTDLGLKFCRNIDSYSVAIKKDQAS